MKKLSIVIIALLAVLVCCKKTPEVNIQYVDVEREVLNIGSTTANIQCDYEYIATLKSAKLYYGKTEDNMNYVNMRVVQSVLYAEITGLKSGTTYKYYYEFENGFNSMQSEVKTFTTEESPTTVVSPTVVTSNIAEITAESAVGGGEVTSDGGGDVTARGICWSTSPNPTLSDSFTTDGTGIGSFVSNLTGLSNNTTYHVRAYATNEAGTAYGLDKEFTTLNGGGGGDHEWVDLGLPSGLLWATCNVGAENPEDYGDYFAWGETTTKSTYNWSTYQYCMGSTSTLTKYCNNSSYGYNGFTDNLTTLLPEDDAATANWGDGWRMPTKVEFEELYNNTTVTWTTQNGVNGRRFTAPNGNSLFLPAAGFRDFSSLYLVGSRGVYWSSSLSAGNPHYAWAFDFSSVDYYMNYYVYERDFGQSVRPVRLGQN